MSGNLEELTQALNIELINIKVSEELKLKTLEKCKKSEKISFRKVSIPITCTLAACLLVGIVVYPYYTKNSIIGNEQITMNSSERSIKASDKSIIDSPRLGNEVNIKENENSKIYSNEIVDESQKKVNENSKEQQGENRVIALNENPTVAFKAKVGVESEEMDKSILSTSQGNENASINSTTEKGKDASTIALPTKQNNDALSNEETKMKDLSLQEAIKVFGDSLKIPSYVPKEFNLSTILVPELGDDSNVLYEITYSDNNKYFKITEYKDVDNTKQLDSNSNIESETPKENYMVINLNNVAVKYILSESDDNTECAYVKSIWENSGKNYRVEGNIPWTELINVISSIIN